LPTGILMRGIDLLFWCPRGVCLVEVKSYYLLWHRPRLRSMLHPVVIEWPKKSSVYRNYNTRTRVHTDNGILTSRHYEGSPRSTRPNKENTKNLGKNIFISLHSLLLARYTFPSDVQ
jgi:hypothetical protein